MNSSPSNNKCVNLLIIDDHPMTIKAYKSVFECANQNYCFLIDQAHNCDEVLRKINKITPSNYHLILLDLRIPASYINNLIDGVDLGHYLKERYPKTKIIIHTSLSNKERIRSIIETLRPEGFLIKSEIVPNTLLTAAYKVLAGDFFYSSKVQKILDEKKITSISIDSFDRKILHYLSAGEKMKNLPKYLPMSISTIERRTRLLKIKLDIPECTKLVLLKEAKRHGLI